MIVMVNETETSSALERISLLLDRACSAANSEAHDASPAAIGDLRKSEEPHVAAYKQGRADAFREACQVVNAVTYEEEQKARGVS